MISRKSSGSNRVDSARRADQVAEHHRQLPPLGLGGDCCSCWSCVRGGLRCYRYVRAAIAASSFRRCPIELMPRPIRSSAVNSGSTSRVDVVGFKRRRILPEAQLAQPFADIGRHLRCRLSCRSLQSCTNITAKKVRIASPRLAGTEVAILLNQAKADLRRSGHIRSHWSERRERVTPPRRRLRRAGFRGCGRGSRPGSSAAARGRSCRRSPDRRCPPEPAATTRAPVLRG